MSTSEKDSQPSPNSTETSKSGQRVEGPSGPGSDKEGANAQSEHNTEGYTVERVREEVESFLSAREARSKAMSRQFSMCYGGSLVHDEVYLLGTKKRLSESEGLELIRKATAFVGGTSKVPDVPITAEACMPSWRQPLSLYNPSDAKSVMHPCLDHYFSTYPLIQAVASESAVRSHSPKPGHCWACGNVCSPAHTDWTCPMCGVVYPHSKMTSVDEDGTLRTVEDYTNLADAEKDEAQEKAYQKYKGLTKAEIRDLYKEPDDE